tara:strand:+ start:640 stop:801 length:162 start_codon:yes stop_codon:yes gene_type:complete
MLKVMDKPKIPIPSPLLLSGTKSDVIVPPPVVTIPQKPPFTNLRNNKKIVSSD